MLQLLTLSAVTSSHIVGLMTYALFAGGPGYSEEER